MRRVAEPTREAAFSALNGAYQITSEFVGKMDEPDFYRPTRCAGWCVADVVFHLLLDAQRALVALATPAEGEPDVDFVSYWRPFKPGTEDSLKHARFVRIAAAAYSSPETVAAHRRELADAVLRAAASSEAERIQTQGHVLSVPDFLATLTVEATIHHLDMIEAFPDAPGADESALGLVRRTLDGLLGQSVPMKWDDAIYALKGSGRLPLSKEERATLGEISQKFPLLG